ncbi:unnamed protein product [Arctia plantaginis]|uniref:Mitochondrial genome maintenance exonuclease 1 n=1 Tax=Arctia plantaginis TaxID=874455 RepID=A0A8S1B0V0_ARCPL|nr:unnamed protein product [Arctia plantaginis]
MFRPVCTIGQRISFERKLKEFFRNKVVRPASVLKPAEKIKLYNKENKDLFGPLLETNKQKKQRLQKAAKNSASHQNNGARCQETKLKYKESTERYVRQCDPLIGYSSICSAAQPGYVSEDKILQIKHHQNDYAQQYPSVTLILNKTMTDDSRTALEKWKQERIAEMGVEEFNKFYEAQMAVGTKFHNTLKNYFTQPKSQLRIEKEVEGVWTSVNDILKSISAPKAIESNVVHPVLKYRGVFDAIADYEEKPTLIEWKKSDKPPKSIRLNLRQSSAVSGVLWRRLQRPQLQTLKRWKEIIRRGYRKSRVIYAEFSNKNK